MQASELISDVGATLNDEGNTRWTSTELLDYLNSGIRTIVSIKPESHYKVESVQLSQGSEQTVPSDADKLLGVIRYMGTDGNTPGRPVYRTERQVMDRHRRKWHQDRQKDEVVHYIFDEQSPRNFAVWPPNTGSGYVELRYSQHPSEIASSDEIPLPSDESYEEALYHYMLYRALSKESDTTEPGKWQGYLNLFYQDLGMSPPQEGRNGQT